jgi:hypothetical protein
MTDHGCTSWVMCWLISKEYRYFWKPLHNTLHVRKKRQYIILIKYATTTWCICIKIVKLYENTWFGVVLWTITSSRASTVRHNQGKNIIDEREKENMNAEYVYSHHDDECDQDDVGDNDEGLDVEELM